MKKFKRYLLGLTMALNQFVNAVTGGNPDMSVSARAGYARERGSKVGAGMCHFLNWLDRRDGDTPEGEHCASAIRNYERDIKRQAEEHKQ